MQLPGAEIMHTTDLANQLKQDYLSYALSTLNRSLPVVTDGLKLSQRRVMQIALNSEANHQLIKLTRLTGDVLGKLHPHSPADNVAVNLANGADYPYPLLYIQGNAGGWSRSSLARLSEDSAASARYLEIKTTDFAKFVFDLPLELLDTKPNYDGRELEVTQYAPALPLLAILGGTGISTGYACNFAPYNLIEVCSVIAKHLTDKIPLESLANILSPDFGNDVELLNDIGLKEARLGAGKLSVRGKWSISTSGKKPTITITSLPFISAEKFCEMLKTAVNAEKITAISDCRDLSNADGIQIVLTIKKGFEIDQAKSQIISYTGFEDNFNVNQTAIGTSSLLPKQHSLAELITEWLDYRLQALENKRLWELKKAKQDFSLQSALLKFLANAKNNIKLLINASNEQTAKVELMAKLKLNEAEANYILSIPIRRLLASEVELQANKVKSLETKIQLLTNQDNNKLIIETCKQAITLFGKKRVTKIVSKFEAIEIIKPIKQPKLTIQDKLLQEATKKGVKLSTRRVNILIKEAHSKGLTAIQTLNQYLIKS